MWVTGDCHGTGDHQPSIQAPHPADNDDDITTIQGFIEQFPIVELVSSLTCKEHSHPMRDCSPTGKRQQKTSWLFSLEGWEVQRLRDTHYHRDCPHQSLTDVCTDSSILSCVFHVSWALHTSRLNTCSFIYFLEISKVSVLAVAESGSSQSKAGLQL